MSVKDIDKEEFVKDWQRGVPVKELSEKFEVSEISIRNLVFRMKKAGVKLTPRIVRYTPEEVQKLNLIAQPQTEGSGE